uniref:Integrase core domain containing protein n=1 Tax=Solanum tuberosum TaxID=4113 RepID=M1DZ42_SOLTU
MQIIISWKDRDRECRDRNPNWKDGVKDMYVSPHERQKSKDSERGRSQDMLSRILNKVEGAVHVFLANSHSTELGESGTVVPLEVTSGTDAQDQGKGQVGDEMEQSARRRSVPRSSTISPKDSKREKAEG